MIPVLVLVAAAVSLVLPEIGLGILAYQPVIQYSAVGPIRVAYPLFLGVLIGFLLLVRREHVSLRASLTRRRGLLLAGLLVLCGYMGVTALWSPLPLLALARSIKALVVVGMGWLGFLCLLHDPRRLRRFVLVLLFAGAALTAIGLVESVRLGWSEFLPGISGEKQALYRQAVGFTLILALALLIWGRAEIAGARAGTTGLMALVTLGAWALLHSGSRGLAVTAAPLALGIIGYALARSSTRSSGALALGCVGVAVVVFCLGSGPSSRAWVVYRNTVGAFRNASHEDFVTIAREQSPLSEGGRRFFRFVESEWDAPLRPGEAWEKYKGAEDQFDSMVMGGSFSRIWQLFGRRRDRRMIAVWEMPGEGLERDVSFCGHLGTKAAALAVFHTYWLHGAGVGGYWVMTRGCWPDNMLLEIAADLGTIGLLLTALWFLPALVAARRLLVDMVRRHTADLTALHLGVIAIVFCFGLLDAQIHGVVEDHRTLFLLTPGLVLAYTWRSQGSSRTGNDRTSAGGSSAV